MAQSEKQPEVYLEIGQSRTFAVTVDWPGWCRSGRNEDLALQTLCDYGARYAKVLQTTSLNFRVPNKVDDFVVIERLTGNATTDFGAPDLTLSSDTNPVDSTELERWQEILQACWNAFDKTVEAATGKTLSKGPRGGGRELPKIIEHVREGDFAYLKSLGGSLKLKKEEEPINALPAIREAIVTTLNAAARGEIPSHGPRGGARWPARYFVRRLAWHELDHTWEIEDRAGLLQP